MRIRPLFEPEALIAALEPRGTVQAALRPKHRLLLGVFEQRNLVVHGLVAHHLRAGEHHRHRLALHEGLQGHSHPLHCGHVGLALERLLEAVGPREELVRGLVEQLLRLVLEETLLGPLLGE